ncbi:MAG: 3-hydroxyacyl-CoA dehydrogenase family protein [Myxococcales bacterium]|nr:3-hydroxyacyl-CoA dehydrogenase family protein [Myxococcales bacterium]
MLTVAPANIAVIGAGTMGRGIGYVAAINGISVNLIDLDAERLNNALHQIDHDLNKGIEKGKISTEDKIRAMSKIQPTTDMAKGVDGVEFVIEAVFEDMQLKKKLFSQMESLVPNSTILGTNTSSLSITDIAQATATPSRVIGMHFFNPPHIMTLLEIVRGEHTDQTTLERTLKLGQQLHRDCIVVADSPGFATSRLGLVIGLEAMRMLQEGVAVAADIDRAMELGYRHPMGPLKLTDLVGLDVRLAIAEHLHREIGEQFRPPAILRRLVRAGKLGKKTGEGFYVWK